MENRDGYCKLIGNSEVEHNYVNRIYDRVLDRVYKKWKNNLKSLEIEKLQKQVKEQEKMKRKPAYQIILWLALIAFLIFAIIKWGLIILCGIGFILLLVILGASKEK